MWISEFADKKTADNEVHLYLRQILLNLLQKGERMVELSTFRRERKKNSSNEGFILDNWRVLLSFFNYWNKKSLTSTNHRFLNTLDTTLSNIHQQQTGWKHPQGFMWYLSPNFEARYLLSSCPNCSIDKKFQS